MDFMFSKLWANLLEDGWMYKLKCRAVEHLGIVSGGQLQWPAVWVVHTPCCQHTTPPPPLRLRRSLAWLRHSSIQSNFVSPDLSPDQLSKSSHRELAQIHLGPLNMKYQTRMPWECMSTWLAAAIIIQVYVICKGHLNGKTAIIPLWPRKYVHNILQQTK